MADKRSIEVREFRERVTQIETGSGPIAVTDQGRVIGVFIPVKRNEEARQRAIDKFDQTVRQILSETGMSEDELVALLCMPES